MRGLTIVSFSILMVAGLLPASSPYAYGQTPAYGRRYSKAQVERAIAQLENNTDQFKRYMDRELDRSAIDRLPAEDRIWDRVSDLERSTNGLRQRFDRTDSWWETRSEVKQVVEDGRRLNRILNRYRQYLKIRGRWAMIKREINSLARYYNLQVIR
jgi:hypothetical protein